MKKKDKKEKVIYYPMDNKIWFNQMGGFLYKTTYLEKEKNYVVGKIPWNRLNNYKNI